MLYLSNSDRYWLLGLMAVIGICAFGLGRELGRLEGRDEGRGHE